MFGLGKSISLSLAGWLWADLLLGLFVVFLAANSVGLPPEQVAPSPTPAVAAVDPQPIEITVKVDGPLLLGGAGEAVRTEQSRIADEVRRALTAAGETRRVALVLAFASHESPADGDRLAKLATDRLRVGAFAEAAMKHYHELVVGDRGSAVALEIYLYR